MDAHIKSQYLEWLMSFVTRKEGKVPHALIVCSAALLAKLTWPGNYYF